MPTIDFSSLNFHGEEPRSIRDTIIEAIYNKPEIAAVFNIKAGVKTGKKIPVMGLMGLVGKADQGCDPTADNASITVREISYDPKGVSHRQAECYEDIEDSFFQWATKNGYEIADLQNTDYLNFVVDRLTDAIYESIMRHAWFGDLNAAVIASGGILTAGTNPDYFNVIDGIWAQVYDIATADSTKLISGSSYWSAKNGQSTFALQKFNPTDTTNLVATITLQDMWYNADERLRALQNTGDLVYFVTQTVADQYERELLKASGIPPAWETLQNGFRALRINGIPVVPVPFWDRMINTYEKGAGSNFVRNKPHRAILTTPDNLHFVTDDAQMLTSIDVFYDKVSKKTIADALYKIDVKVVLPELLMTAY